MEENAVGDVLIGQNDKEPNWSINNRAAYKGQHPYIFYFKYILILLVFVTIICPIIFASSKILEKFKFDSKKEQKNIHQEPIETEMSKI
jgi:hypothetical protein